MRLNEKYDYDVIIIGAGISGLVCGCYLAKAGLKILIVEKNHRVGGYCSSFKRGGLIFDSCVHSLGGLRNNGYFSLILNELEILSKINITRYDPSDIIITPDYKISIWNDIEKTKREFKEYFPKEVKSISVFFDYLRNLNTRSYLELRNKNFKEVLDSYFKDSKLKAILSIFVLGNTGLPSSLVSAFTAASLYKEFMLDGGYYPQGGMQALSDAILKRFKELHGDVLLSKIVKKIRIKDSRVEGVEFDDGKILYSKHVVSNADARHTFLELIGGNKLNGDMVNKLNTLEPSLSMFILYLGVDSGIQTFPPSSNVWALPHYNIEELFRLDKNADLEKIDCFLVRILPNKKSIMVLASCGFKNIEYWQNNKDKLTEVFIKKVERLIPDLSKHLIFKDSATPFTLYKRTLNYQGAAYGWAGMPSQFAILGFAQTTLFDNLYLTGHWTTLTQGVSGVAYLGRSTAQIILNKIKK